MVIKGEACTLRGASLVRQFCYNDPFNRWVMMSSFVLFSSPSVVLAVEVGADHDQLVHHVGPPAQTKLSLSYAAAHPVLVDWTLVWDIVASAQVGSLYLLSKVCRRSGL